MNHTKKLKIKKAYIVTTLLAFVLFFGFSSCTVEEEIDLVSTDQGIENLKTTPEISLKNTGFTPNPDRLYHITPLGLAENRGIGANGNTFPFLNAGSYSLRADEVRWKFTPAPTDGYYFIDCIGGRNNTRLRSNNNSVPAMDSATFDGGLSQWSISPAGDNSYFLTTKEGTPNRLSIFFSSFIRVVSDDLTTTNQQFVFTEIPENENQLPQAYSDFTNHFVGETITYSVLDNDFDPDGDEINVINVSGGAPNIVEWIGNEIRVTRTSPAVRYIWYEISDGRGGTDTAAINLRNQSGNNG